MRPRRSKHIFLFVMLLVGLGGLGGSGCRDSSSTPDPESFGPFEETSVDPKVINFFNGSVEMANLEIFAPAAKIKDCQAEAPHRLLCPSDYRHIFDKRENS